MTVVASEMHELAAQLRAEHEAQKTWMPNHDLISSSALKGAAAIETLLRVLQAFQAQEQIRSSGRGPEHGSADLSTAFKQIILQEDDYEVLLDFFTEHGDQDAIADIEMSGPMARLAELGAVERIIGRRERFKVTAFGAWLIETEFAQNPRLPIRTRAEHREREGAGRALYLQESAAGCLEWDQLTDDQRESWRRKATEFTLCGLRNG
ncbi:hypothetical protein [Burkholderia cepacia]|uniref:hypothetical protein n=1 Tax=Burkholderia cepacia TaxID=292 RepID=UPI002AB6B960|nr:hypothetical protein [Burkholderia cepacia]